VSRRDRTNCRKSNLSKKTKRSKWKLCRVKDSSGRGNRGCRLRRGKLTWNGESRTLKIRLSEIKLRSKRRLTNKRGSKRLNCKKLKIRTKCSFLLGNKRLRLNKSRTKRN
jgi:hypothetical protein